MANGNLSACLAITLKHEGLYSDHKSDPGGATMKGITLATFRRYRPKATKADLRNISDIDLRTIYRDGFWNPINAEMLPYGIDLATFDYGVNSGPSRGAKALQSVLGVKQDGAIGPATLAAVGNPKTVIQKLCAKRLGFVQGLKTWQTFGKGWARRIADIEARAVAMWLSHAGRQSVPVDMEVEASKASKTAADQDKGAAGTVATGGAGGAADVAANGSVNWWLIGALALAVLVTVGVLAWKARNNKLRAAAYRAVSLEAAVGGAVK